MKKYKKPLIIILALIIIPLVSELIIGKLKINNEQSQNYLKQTQTIKAGATYRLNLNNAYFYRLKIAYQSDNNVEAIININQRSYQLQLLKSDNDKVWGLDKKVTQITIQAADNLKIRAISSLNHYQFNYYRYLLFEIITLIGSLYVAYRRYFKAHLERLFLLIAISFGCFFILVMPPVSGYTPDDQIHLSNTYSLLDYPLSQISEAEGIATSASDYGIYSRDDHNELINYLNSSENQKTVAYKNISLLVSYNKLGYFPAASTMKVAKMLGCPYTIVYQIGKLTNLLIYTLIGFWAIKIAKYGKKLFFAVSLIPTSLFLAASYSLDGMTFVGIMMMLVLWLNKQLSGDSVDFKWSCGFIAFGIIGCLSKPIFAPLMLLPLLFKSQQFESVGQSLRFKAAIVLVCLVMSASFIMPLFDNAATPGDFRGGVVSIGGQIRYILSNPIAFITMFFPQALITIINNLVTDYHTYADSFYLDATNMGIGLIYMLSLFAVMGFDDSLRDKLNKPTRISVLILVLLIGFIINGTMYLSFSEIGAGHINGVQNRYFLPLVPLMLIGLSGLVKIKDHHEYYLDVITVSSLLAIAAFMYTVVIQTCCL